LTAVVPFPRYVRYVFDPLERVINVEAISKCMTNERELGGTAAVPAAGFDPGSRAGPCAERGDGDAGHFGRGVPMQNVPVDSQKPAQKRPPARHWCDEKSPVAPAKPEHL